MRSPDCRQPYHRSGIFKSSKRKKHEADPPPEKDKLLLSLAAELARDGRSVADLMRTEASVVTQAQVMEGIAEMVPEVQIEATFPDGTKLVTVHHPIR